jgi:hypothetical protein
MDAPGDGAREVMTQEVHFRGPVDLKARRWTIKVISLLLCVQAGLLGTTALSFWISVDWQAELEDVMPSIRALDILFLGGFLIPLAVVEAITAAQLWMAQRGAWLRAMIVQGILLIFCLSSYVSRRDQPFIYIFMLTAIVIVLYLNTNDVRLAFTSRRPSTQRPRSVKR